MCTRVLHAKHRSNQRGHMDESKRRTKPRKVGNAKPANGRWPSSVNLARPNDAFGNPLKSSSRSCRLPPLPGACETAQQQGLLVPTACPKARRQCLTLLSEALRKYSSESCRLPPLPGACETAQQQGLLVPTACPKARRQCLTLLSEALRKV